MYDSVAYLIQKVTTDEVDAYGDKLIKETKRRVFCKMKSISYKELYQAQSVGYKPEIALELADYRDYADEADVEFDGYRYKVLRTYRLMDTRLQLTLYEGVRVNVGT